MTAHVISHHEPAGKRRRRAWLTITRHAGALAVVLCALAIASWVLIRLWQDVLAPAPPPAVPAPPAPQIIDLAIEPPVIEATPDAARPARRNRGVPLNVEPEAVEPDGYEVLSAAELDAISQERPTE
ncbi:MAG: hypothetical protein R3C16_11570 [Hyphomonadaceae bacterium]